jgi:hypothetical protein
MRRAARRHGCQSQYKDYVLVLLFVKYVSDKYAGQPYAPVTIPAGAGFADMAALKGKSDIGDQINKKILGIRLNTELAKKPRECLEYIVVHEMVHLLEPRHNSRFLAFMDRFMPKWQQYRELLNRLPVHHVQWKY